MTFGQPRALDAFKQRFWKDSGDSGELFMKAVVELRQPMTLTRLSDAELLRLMAAGDEAAFLTIYQRHQRSVYRFALLMTGDANSAEEVTQEVFLAIIREPRRYDQARGSLSAYLYGVARNQVSRLLKRERSYVQLAEETDHETTPTSFVAKDDPLGDCSRNEVIKLVREAVLSLPARYREVIVLCDFEELSCADAAAALDCPVGTVNSRLHRGHALLLKKLRRRSLDPTTTDQRLRCFA